jgi:epoxyqueuosine reductase
VHQSGGENLWLRQTLERLVLGAPENCLADFAGQAIYDAPLVGVADGDDTAFAAFRTAVSGRHLMPREALARHAPPGADLRRIRVVAWAMPFTAPIRRANRGQAWPARLYSAARNNGGALVFLVAQRLVELLRERGCAAVAPVLTEAYDAFRSPEHTFASTWSERHVAWAAGLGLFGLTNALITERGIHVRFGSVVTNLAVEPTPRNSGGEWRAPCRASGGALCGRCMARCPVGAISSDGLDKEKCYAMRRAIRERCLEDYARTLHLLEAPIATGGRKRSGYSLGCALCHSGVPCESRMPAFAQAEAGAHA